MRVLVLLMALAAALAGCVGAEEPAALTPGGSEPPTEPASPSPGPSGGSSGRPPRDPQPGAPQSAPANGSGGAGPQQAGAWPSLDEAVIRPGVQVISETGQCTANFVFQSPDNATLYLGLAAHCVEGLPLGSAMDIAGGAATGGLAYSSWAAMDAANETGGDAREYNDFALVEIPHGARHLVHPAMRHFGGPTALADSSETATGDKVITYGNSGLRFETEPLSWHEGYVLGRVNEWSTTVYTATPGVPGDSGSGVLLGDGRALGVLVTITLAPTAGSNGVTHLDTALEYARTYGGLDVRLATWELIQPGLLPNA